MSRSSKNNVVITADSLIAPFTVAQPATVPAVTSALEVKTHPSTPTTVVTTDESENLPVKQLVYDIKKIKGDLNVTFSYVSKHNYLCINVNGYPVEKIDVKPFNGNEDRIYKYAAAKCARVKSKFLSESK
jgi:hypothetical protein